MRCTHPRHKHPRLTAQSGKRRYQNRLREMIIKKKKKKAINLSPNACSTRAAAAAAAVRKAAPLYAAAAGEKMSLCVYANNVQLEVPEVRGAVESMSAGSSMATL